jgi:plastocyanin
MLRAALRCSLLVLVSGATHGPPEPGPAVPATAAAPAQPGGARMGKIEGHVGKPAQRRVAERYIGAAAPTHSVQEVPVVIVVETAEGSASTRTVRMAQHDTAFSPAVLVVGPGTTVEFLNDDPFFHNVFSYSPTRRFDLGRYPRGESRSVRFDEPGLVKVYCEVHDFMRAAIIVTEHPLYAIVGADGRFSIPEVPAGRQKLVLMHPEHPNREVTVDVREGETTRVDVRFP